MRPLRCSCTRSTASAHGDDRRAEPKDPGESSYDRVKWGTRMEKHHDQRHEFHGQYFSAIPMANRRWPGTDLRSLRSAGPSSEAYAQGSPRASSTGDKSSHGSRDFGGCRESRACTRVQPKQSEAGERTASGKRSLLGSKLGYRSPSCGLQPRGLPGTGAAMKLAGQLFATMMASFVGPLYIAPRLRRARLMWLYYPVALLPLVLLILLVLSLLIGAD